MKSMANVVFVTLVINGSSLVSLLHKFLLIFSKKKEIYLYYIHVKVYLKIVVKMHTCLLY